MGIFNNRVVNTGTTGDVQDNPGTPTGDDFDDSTTFTSGVINSGVIGTVQNASGTGNTQTTNHS